MTIFRRILKYAPGVAMGLLFVAWIASVGREFGVDAALPSRGRINCGFENGTFYSGYNSVAFSRLYYFSGDDENVSHTSSGQGRFETHLAYHPDGSLWRMWCDVPVAVVLSLLLPFAAGAILGFRFRLWHYLAFTALVAIQLAYYLQWQA